MSRPSGTVASNKAKILKSIPIDEQASRSSCHLFRVFVNRFMFFNLISPIPTKLENAFHVLFRVTRLNYTISYYFF